MIAEKELEKLSEWLIKVKIKLREGGNQGSAGMS